MGEVQIVVLLLFLPPFFQSLLLFFALIPQRLLSRNSLCVEKIRLCLPLLS